MAVKKAKTAREGTREPVNKEEQSQQQASNTSEKHVEVQHVEKNGTVCFKLGSQRQLGQQVCPGRVKRDHQHRPEGKLSQSEAENFRAESIGPVNSQKAEVRKDKCEDVDICDNKSD